MKFEENVFSYCETDRMGFTFDTEHIDDPFGYSNYGFGHGYGYGTGYLNGNGMGVGHLTG